MSAPTDSPRESRPIEFTLVHLSDLHFAGGRIPGANRQVHSVPHLRAIQAVLKEIKFDRLIVSGDLSDTGDENDLAEARAWLVTKYEIGDGAAIGLNIDAEVLRAIPGNHDAYGVRGDGSGIEDLQRWQSSLEKYNRIFYDQATTQENRGVRYDWIESEGRGLFFAYIDTSYLGEAEIDFRIGPIPIRAISKVARGRMSRDQTSQLLAWSQLGAKGQLEYPGRPGVFIPAKLFTQSLKIAVGHHYLFEPTGAWSDITMQMDDSRAVFANIAGAEFDMYLCGHKHHRHFRVGSYGKHYDKRGRSRHLINAFRRMVNMTAKPLPMRIEGVSGAATTRVTKALRLTALLASVRERLRGSRAAAPRPGEVEEMSEAEHEKFLTSVIEMLHSALQSPQLFVRELTSFLKSQRIDASAVFTPEELNDIQDHILAQLSAEQRMALRPATKQLMREIRRLANRPFVHAMAGSGAKGHRPGVREAKRRAFYVYRIKADSDGYRVDATSYVWNPLSSEYESEVPLTQMFADSSRKALV